MQAIRTRYYGPTNTRGSRIVAKCEAGTLSMPYNHALSAYQNHATCAALMLKRFSWGKPYVGGCFANDYYWTPHIENHGWNDTIARDYSAKEAA